MAVLPACLPFPAIDPVLLKIGPLSVHWYGLGYVIGIIFAWWYGKRLLARPGLWQNNTPPGKPDILDDFILWAALGIIIGGRLGEVLFYHPAEYFANPLSIFAVWRGGMAFHGGFIGTLIAMLLFAWKKSIPVWSLFDVVAAGVPLGLGLVRLCNFINDELWGRAAYGVPWAVCFPAAPADANGNLIPRHPSQLYEAGLEGILLFIVLAVLIFVFKALKKPGLIAGSFTLGYGLCRIIAEFFREPGISFKIGKFDMTMGMALSLPMIIAGLVIIFYALRRCRPDQDNKNDGNNAHTHAARPKRKAAAKPDRAARKIKTRRNRRAEPAL
ncbi:prolipoprotein diacylglyceryl transferase [Candidatus Tokpelaia sp.]|nr:prolipoprotein diacylglyceryl transferase [Candidatus Tokpelaia sp.]